MLYIDDAHVNHRRAALKQDCSEIPAILNSVHQIKLIKQLTAHGYGSRFYFIFEFVFFFMFVLIY